MKPNDHLILTTSPPPQAAKKPCGAANLRHRQRLLYGRERRNNAGKERDSETGLHYYGARYLDGKTSRWLSGDPAVGEYIPSAPVDDEARKRNGNLPGQGGVFNYINLHVYHYAGNNPVKYTDPEGRDSIWEIDEKAKTINITIPVRFEVGITAEQKQEFYDVAKNWEETFTVNMGLGRGNLTDFTASGEYAVTVNVVEVVGDDKKYEGVNVNTVTFSPLLRDDNNHLIPNVKGSNKMTLYKEHNLKPVITHEIGHLLGLVGSVDGRNFNEGLLRSANKRIFR